LLTLRKFRRLKSRRGDVVAQLEQDMRNCTTGREVFELYYVEGIDPEEIAVVKPAVKNGARKSSRSSIGCATRCSRKQPPKRQIGGRIANTRFRMQSSDNQPEETGRERAENIGQVMAPDKFG
jgi:hypothetical protein